MSQNINTENNVCNLKNSMSKFNFPSSNFTEYVAREKLKYKITPTYLSFNSKSNCYIFPNEMVYDLYTNKLI